MVKSRWKTIVRKSIGLLSWVAPRWSGRIAARWFLSPQKIPASDRETLFLGTALDRERIAGCALWRWGRGPKVILVHGWSGRGAQMSSFVEPLVEVGFEVIAFDAPGHGQSEPGLSSVYRFAQTIHEITKREGGVHAVIGHSIGGSAAVLATAQGALIERLILIGSPTDLNRVFEFFARRLSLSTRGRDCFYRAVEEKLGASPTELSPLTLAPQLQIPALLLHDPHDDQVHIYHAQALEKTWPTAQLRLVDNVGHYRILRAPETLRAVKKFLTQELNAV